MFWFDRGAQSPRLSLKSIKDVMLVLFNSVQLVNLGRICLGIWGDFPSSDSTIAEDCGDMIRSSSFGCCSSTSWLVPGFCLVWLLNFNLGLNRSSFSRGLPRSAISTCLYTEGVVKLIEIL